MKKIYSMMMMLLMMVAALSFTACSSDDDDNETSDVSICGTWKCVSANYGQWDNPDGTKEGDILYMNEDHTYKIVGSNNETGTWTLNGNKLMCDVSGGIPWTYTVTQLTASTLSFTADGFGISLSFKRQ
ncbi:MAG: lipocalin family protein [Prevotella sp.]|nr:lipocalin family protein [Prevotella sp.]